MKQVSSVACVLARQFRNRAGQAYCTHGAPSQLGDLPAVPGTLMRVVATSTPVEIKARQNGETCALQAPAGSGWSWSLTPGSGNQRPVLDIREAAGQAIRQRGGLSATIPDKWISVDVRTSGQSVSVAKLVEANLTVKTEGGDVKLGQVRAYNVEVATCGLKRCGTLKGVEVSGSEVDLRTGSAPIDLERLVGQRVRVELEGKPLSVRSLYAENLEAWTGEGSIDLGNLDVSGGAALNSEGGDVTVHSLDGNANITSAGGDIEVHLHSKVGSVQLDSGGGSVRVAVSPQASVDVVVNGDAQVTCTDAGQDSEPGSSSRVFRFRPSNSQEPTRYGQLSEGRVVVQSGEGDVEIVRVGWMEALKQRLAQATP